MDGKHVVFGQVSRILMNDNENVEDEIENDQVQTNAKDGHLVNVENDNENDVMIRMVWK